MTLTLKPLHDVFAAEASGVDLTAPIAPATARAINAAMNEHAVLVFRGQPLTQVQQIAFATTFGPLDIGLKRVFRRPERLDDERLIDISNVDSAGLHAVVTPSWGGNTEFADLRAAWDALDARSQHDVEGLMAEHYALHTRLLLGDEAYTDDQKEAIAPAAWPLVDVHPGSKRKVLFVGVHARQIVGWPTAESRMFLADLLEHATQRERVYVHQWQPGDLVIWDNRATLHRGRRHDLSERRELRRTTINATPEAMLDAA